MATARAFSVLYGLVAQICQDESTAGLTNAKTAINTIIKELTRDFKLPEMIKGEYGDIFISVPAQTQGLGYQKVSLGVTDISRLRDVWYEQNGRIYPLEPADSYEDWLSKVDNHTVGDPELYIAFLPDSAGSFYTQIWPGASSAWVSNTSTGKLKFSYISQLTQLSADGDIPNIPYELDTALVNGGIMEMARMQADNVLMTLYQDKYKEDRGEIRSWLLRQMPRDVTIGPADAQGTFGQDKQRQGYKL